MNPEDFHDTVPTVEQGRFPYLIEAKITNISDDLGLGRVKVKIRGMADGDETDWLSPAWPGSMEAIASVGEQVWIQFIEGDSAHGVYWWFPIKNTQGRAQEAMMLGTMFVGMFNFMVTQLNQLRTDFNTLAAQAVAHTHAYLPGPGPSAFSGPASGSTPPITLNATTAIAANKGKAADGSAVPDKSTSEVVLSGKLKLH